MKAIGLITCAILAGALALAGLASANGGSSISAAPTIAIGQQLFGNTTDGCFGNCYGADYWNLPLIAADQVTIDWESNPTSGCNDSATDLYVWPIGTTDFSINNTNSLQDFGIGSNHKAESTFTANGTGVFPIMFQACYAQSDGGPYDFTVYVKHKLVTHLASQTTALIARARQTGLPRSGVFSVQVFTGDGKPVSGAIGGTMFGYWASKWHRIGSAVAANGVIAVHYRLPAAVHGVIRLEVNIGGGSFQGKSLQFRGIKT